MAGRAGRAYVLADRLLRGHVGGRWAGRSPRRRRRGIGAREIVAEATRAATWCARRWLGAGVTCPVELVHASEAKQARAQPVAALYEQGRVTHCGAFPLLEEEMLALGVPELEKKLADRADALVWALTALMIRPTKPPPRISLLGD